MTAVKRFCKVNLILCAVFAIVVLVSKYSKQDSCYYSGVHIELAMDSSSRTLAQVIWTYKRCFILKVVSFANKRTIVLDQEVQIAFNIGFWR